MKTKTWLPLFPGFYSTILEPDEESEIYRYNQENGTDLDYDAFNWDYDEYRERAGKAFCNRVENELNEFLPVKIKYQSVYSPREYNFENDSIYIEVTFSLGKLLKLIKDRKEEAAQYFKDTFTSRSGFISFHSADIYDWLNPEYIREKPSFRVGALLECLLWCEIDTEDIIYWVDSELYLNYELKEPEKIV